MNAVEFQTRVEVTDHTGRHTVIAMSLETARYVYPPQLGFRLREVRGYPAADGSGFCIVNRTNSADSRYTS